MKKYTGILVAFLAFMLSLPLNVHAESEKTIEVKLPKDYIAATFSIKFQSSRDDCITTIISPDGMEYAAEYTNSDTMKCVVNNVKEGKWKIKITSLTGSDIGVVDVTVEGSKSQIVEEADNIKVASDITGLILYMKDDNLEVEWNDNSCGAVKITVADGLSLQILENTTISTREPCHYSFEVPDGREQLLVTVVPTTSANLAGAAKSFTMSTYNHPDAEVILDAEVQTNKSSINVKAVLNDTYKVICYANDKLISESEYLTPGEYSFEVPVASGNNGYKVYIVDENHYMRSKEFSCIGDFIAPQLMVDGGSRNVTVNEENFHISGNVSEFYTLTINGNNIDNVYSDGIFEYDYILHEGDNMINIVASDEAGNTSECDIYVTYEIPDYSFLYIAGGCFVGLIILIVTGVLLYKKVKTIKKDRKPHERKEKPKQEQKKVSESASKHYPVNKLVEIAVIVITLLIVLKFMIAVVVIQSESMEPTLKTGDIAIFNRLAYVVNEVQIGDIVCVWSEEENKYIGKRIIGLPGDNIVFRDGNVVVNGRVLDENLYIDTEIETNCTLEFNVPEGCYFILGDNREISKDSRYYENPYISADDIIGKYMGFSGVNLNF